MKNRNECYTYFKITGNFVPDCISNMLGLRPERQCEIGKKRKNGTNYDFALWEFGRCDEYDVFTNNQMLRTIEPLLLKVEVLKRIKQEFDANLTLEIVPTVYVGEVSPCLAPSSQVIRFCYESGTDIDIALMSLIQPMIRAGCEHNLLLLELRIMVFTSGEVNFRLCLLNVFIRKRRLSLQIVAVSQ